MGMVCEYTHLALAVSNIGGQQELHLQEEILLQTHKIKWNMFNTYLHLRSFYMFPSRWTLCRNSALFTWVFISEMKKVKCPQEKKTFLCGQELNFKHYFEKDVYWKQMQQCPCSNISPMATDACDTLITARHKEYCLFVQDWLQRSIWNTRIIKRH